MLYGGGLVCVICGVGSTWWRSWAVGIECDLQSTHATQSQCPAVDFFIGDMVPVRHPQDLSQPSLLGHIESFFPHLTSVALGRYNDGVEHTNFRRQIDLWVRPDQLEPLEDWTRNPTHNIMISISVACKDTAQVGELVHLLQWLLSYHNGILCCQETNPHDLGLVPTDQQARFGPLAHTTTNHRCQQWCQALTLVML